MLESDLNIPVDEMLVMKLCKAGKILLKASVAWLRTGWKRD